MGAGRKTKLTPAVHASVVESLRKGNYIETAAALAGVSKRVVFDWLKRGRDEDAEDKDTVYTRFLRAVEKADAEAEGTMLDQISIAAAENWQAAAWRLERKHPDRWGRRVKTEVSGPNGAPVKVQVLKIGETEIPFETFGGEST